jgi:hypothetical protein
MYAKYCLASIHGAILHDTIEVGWNENMPEFVASKFKIRTGSQSQPLTIYVADRRLALEVYAWKKAIANLDIDSPRITLSVSASILARGEAALLFANEIAWGTPFRELRILAEKLHDSMVSGEFKDYKDLETIQFG